MLEEADLGGLQRDLDISALEREVEADALVAHEVQCDFGEALLLQVRDDGLSAKRSTPDHGQHLHTQLLAQPLSPTTLRPLEATKTVEIEGRDAYATT